MPPTPPDGAAAPRSALLKITTVTTRNTTARTGKTNRSKACTRLWPKTANPVCATTISVSASGFGIPVSVLSANAPLTLLVANQPTPHMIDMNAAGSALPR